MTYTQVRITIEYRDKLKALATRKHRSMASQLEVLVDQALENEIGDMVGKAIRDEA